MKQCSLKGDIRHRMNKMGFNEIGKYTRVAHIQNKTLLFKMEGVPICENNSILK